MGSIAPGAPVLQVAGLVVAQGQGVLFTTRVNGLRLAAGDLLCLGGASGSGKSTLLDTFALLARAHAVEQFQFRPEAGSAPIDLVPLLLAGRMQELAHFRSGALGYAPQSGGMLPFLTAREDAMSAAVLGHRRIPPELRNRFTRLAAALRLDNDLDKSRASLSGGQRKRVSLLRALAVPRRLLVLDEPTAGLDETTAVQALEVIARTCRDEGTACIVASHDRQRVQDAGFRFRDLHPVSGLGPSHTELHDESTSGEVGP